MKGAIIDAHIPINVNIFLSMYQQDTCKHIADNFGAAYTREFVSKPSRRCLVAKEQRYLKI